MLGLRHKREIYHATALGVMPASARSDIYASSLGKKSLDHIGPATFVTRYAFLTHWLTAAFQATSPALARVGHREASVPVRSCGQDHRRTQGRILFEINTSAVGDSLGLTALVAILPLIAFFIMLLGVKARAHTSGAVALAVSILIAILGFSMPVDMALSSAVRGGLFGLLPIVWVIITAIWFYEITVASGRFEDLRKTFDLLGDGDIRILSLIHI